jgi:ADP-heptose:LPS heptosyltransferase
MERLLFVTLSNIGDVVLTTPALVALHQTWPDAVIDIVADRRSSDVLKHCPFLGQLFHRDKDAGLKTDWCLLKQLRTERYCVVVDLRTDVLPWLLRARRRSVKWRAPKTLGHAVERHFAALQPILPKRQTIPDPEVWTNPAAEDWAHQQLQPFSGRILGLAPGANWAPKCWPLARYIELAQGLTPDFDAMLIFGSPSEVEAAQTIASTVSLPTLNLAGKTTLLQAAAALQYCQAFVGNDSGLGHLAAACRVPTMSVFGPGHPARYRPWGSLAAIVCAPAADLNQLPAYVVANALRDHLRQLGGST